MTRTPASKSLNAAIEDTCRRSASTRRRFALWMAIVVMMSVGRLSAQECPGDFPLQNFAGVGQVACPCFVPGEEAGAIFELPPGTYPIEILKIGIGWGSTFGGTPQSIEQAVHLYAGGLPDPGTPQFSLLGPLMNDGFINEFDIEFMSGNKVIDSGPFTVTLEFLNQNAGNVFAPSMVHDGNGCQAGKNIVKANPGGWSDACPLGVTGDWVVTVTYRCSGATAVEESMLSNRTRLWEPRPNPVGAASRITFSLAESQHASVRILDVRGRPVATLAERGFLAGRHVVTWQGRDAQGRRLPRGIYFVRLQAGAQSLTRKVVLRGSGD